MVTAWDGEQLVGILGYVVRPAFWGSTAEPVSGAWLIALMVAPEYRHGIGVALLRNVQRRFPLIAALDVRPEAQRILRALGFTSLGTLTRYVMAIDPALLRAFLIRGGEHPAVQPVTEPTAAADRVSVRTWDPEDQSPIWDQYPPLLFGTVRSPAFLRWRYLRHPVYAYTILSCGPPTRPAIAVYRIETPRGLEAKVGRLIEFFHPGDDLGRAAGATLLRELARRFSAAGCAYADHVTSSADYGRTLHSAGWTREDPHRQSLALRLQPVDPTPYPEYRFATLAYSTTGNERRLLDGDSIYVTRGDGDADRPGTIE